MSQKILVIDDESQIQRFLKIALEGSGYEVLLARQGQQGLEKAGLDSPDLILLDLGLPDLAGLEVLQRLREWTQIPVIVLSVQEQERDKVAALDRGADDYLTKPFGVQELLARIRVALRHAAARTEPGDDNSSVQFGPIRVDRASRQIWKGEEPVKLTKTEYKLLALLIQHAGKVLTHRHILREIWGAEYTGETHYLQVYISQLRRKLEDDPTEPRYFLTEPGIGYRLLAEG
ncbi:MAG: response regulator [Candidatus Sericytochromatia bacterium]